MTATGASFKGMVYRAHNPRWAFAPGLLNNCQLGIIDMSNRQLKVKELDNANKLLDEIRKKLIHLSGDDNELLFAYRRKIYKELTYDERGKPMWRRKLKRQKLKEQHGICPLCGKQLPERYSVLDRFKAVDGYTAENTQLIHRACDVSTQESRGYA